MYVISETKNDLQKQWRRVASTHDLKELLETNKFRKRPFSQWKVLFLGLFILLLSVAFFLEEVYLLIISKFIVYKENSWSSQDKYYCVLVPLLIPATITAVILNWFSMKFFKHNS